MKKILFAAVLFFAIFICGCSQQKKENTGTIVHLTNDQFKKMVFNYQVNKEWKYEGNKPAIIDFYAEWCGPCKMMAPRLEEIAKEYAGKLVVYKVDTDKEKELSMNLGIQSLHNYFYPSKWKAAGFHGGNS